MLYFTYPEKDEIDTNDLIGRLDEMARTDFDAKPGEPEPHRDIMLSAAKRLREQQRLITRLKNENNPTQGISTDAQEVGR